MAVASGFFYTMMILGLIGIIFLAIQLLFCLKAKRMAVKLIPVYFILFCLLVAALFYVGAFGTGFLNAERIVAWLIGIGVVAATVGDAIAWAIYGSIIKIRR